MPDADYRALIERAREHTSCCQIAPIVPCQTPICLLCGESWPCLPARLAAALEQETQRAERLEVQLFNCIDGPHTGHKYTREGEEPFYCCPAHQDGYTWLEQANRERDAAQQAATAEAALHDLTRVERDAARSALTTVLRGMRSSWWANDHPDWIRAMENALAATKEEPRDGN